MRTTSEWPFNDYQKWHVNPTSENAQHFTGFDLRRFYDAIDTQEVGNGTVPHLVGGSVGSDRVVDRALQLLKRHGLVIFVRGRWVKTGQVPA